MTLLVINMRATGVMSLRK